MNGIVAQLTLTLGEKVETINIGSEALANAISGLPDEVLSEEILALLASHQSAEVRSRIAGKDNLPEDAIRMLAKDSSRNVVYALLNSSSARSMLSAQELLAICKKDPELAGSVAGNLEDFSGVDTDAVLELLEHHPDPDVRLRLISSYNIQKRTLQRIANNDPDEEVKARARNTLANR